MGESRSAFGAIVAARAFALAGEPVPRFYARPLGMSLLAIVLFGIALQWLGLVAAVMVLVLVGAYAAHFEWSDGHLSHRYLQSSPCIPQSSNCRFLTNIVFRLPKPLLHHNCN